MALIALDPPSALPRGWKPRRPFSPGCGSVCSAQLWIFGRPEIVVATSAGARTNRLRPSPPASTRHTVVPGSSLSRAASAQPAEPPPRIT